MSGCSRRRKTKAPYCKDNPNCYWDKTCKRKTRRSERSPRDLAKLSKLDTILSKVVRIEREMKMMRKNMTMKRVVPRTNATESRKVRKTEKRRSADRTASPNKVARLLNNVSLNGKSYNTASPAAVRQLRDI